MLARPDSLIFHVTQFLLFSQFCLETCLFFFFECAQKLKHSETCNVIVLYVNMKKEQNYERPSASILRDVTETGKCPFLKGTNYCMG